MWQQLALVWINMVNTPALPSSPGLHARQFTSGHCQAILRLLWSHYTTGYISWVMMNYGMRGWCWLLAHNTAALTSDSAPHTRSGPCRISGWRKTWKTPSCCSWYCKIWPSMAWWPAFPIQACTTLWAWVVNGKFAHMVVVQPDRVVQPGNVACWYWGWCTSSGGKWCSRAGNGKGAAAETVTEHQ